MTEDKSELTEMNKRESTCELGETFVKLKIGLKGHWCLQFHNGTFEKRETARLVILMLQWKFHFMFVMCYQAYINAI